MSHESLLSVAMGAAMIARGSFVLGRNIDKSRAVKALSKLVKTNPYAFYLKDKLFEMFEDVPAKDNEPPNRMEQILKYGFPGLDDIRVFSDFVLSYDRRNRVPQWVLEHLKKDCLGTRYGVNRRLAEFQSDHEVPLPFRSHNYDYFRSGFDRGHLAAAGNHKCAQVHTNETFLLSNIAPQVGVGFNRDAWNNLEIYVRDLADVYPDVYVCTGPAYQPTSRGGSGNYVEYQVIGRSLVAVPTHFFKVIVCEKDKKFVMEAYFLPNAFISNDVDLKTFRRPPEEIEAICGLKFFDKIKRSQYVSINGVQVPASEEGNES